MFPGTAGESQIGRCRTRRDLLRAGGCLGAVGLAGCLGSSGTDGVPSDGRTVDDATGRTVQLPARVDRLVAVGPGALNLVCYLDATDLVAGVEEHERTWGTATPYNTANPSLRELPVVGPRKGGDPERILEADPDVVFATYVTGEAATDLQNKIDRPVVVVRAESRSNTRFEPLYDDLEFVGGLVGREARATDVIEFLRSERRNLERLTEAIPPADRTAAYIAGRSASGGTGVTSTQHPFAPFEFVNVDNVADSISGHATISEEKLAVWDPEIVFVAGSNAEQVSTELAAQYTNLTAVGDGALYTLLPSRFYGDLFGSVVANAYYVGSVVYPEAFADVDPVERADDIYRTLLGTGVYDEVASAFEGFGRLSEV